MKKDSQTKSAPFWNGPNIFAGVVCLVVLIAFAFHVIDQHRFVRSTDALVQAHYATLAARVPGLVSAVYVEEHERVRKGQILAKLDDRDYQTKQTQAAKTREATEAQLRAAQQDFSRAQKLFELKDISEQSYTQAKTNFQTKLRQIEASEAQYQQAIINRDYTLIRAPDDGTIAIRAATAGMEVKEGDSLFGIVYQKEKWVEARIKETDLNDVQVGEAVEVKIDAIPGRKFKGTLQSISPTTEGLEAAIVPDNSAGNYTKYVQRVPVKIALSLSAPDQELVRVGLSANVRLKRGM